MRTKSSVSFHLLELFIFGVIAINLVYINILVLKNNRQPFSFGTSAFTQEQSASLADVSADKTDTCGKDCIKDIYGAIYEATSSSRSSQDTVLITDTQKSDSVVKEYFVSFGSGTNATEEWTDVPGLSVYVDSTKYPSIKKVTFEASVRIPTGNQKAYVRLFNATDKHPVWYSDLFLEGGATQLLISPAIQLDSGSKLYAVQMKTSLKFETNLLQSRLHIVLN